MGIKCPPATHAYQPFGKILFCQKCGDVQALLLDEAPTVSYTHEPHQATIPDEPQIDDEQAIRETEAYLTRLRNAAGIGEPPKQMTLDQQVNDLAGMRGEYQGDFENDRPRVPVAEGFNTHAIDDSLPGAGL